MKNSWQTLTILLAVALLALSIKTVMQRGEQTETLDKGAVVVENIMTRSSVRTYTSQPVEQDKIDILLKAGMAAPTAGNKQPWEIMVINDRKILDAFPPLIKGTHMAAKAQQAIVVLGTPAKALLPEYWIQDCSAVTENILLAAHGLGLGAVWCGAYPENGTNRVEGMSKLLNLQDGTYALNVIVIGYPEGEPIVKDKWDASKVYYNTYK